MRRVAETDRLRSALLTSISHDLKTPLAAVLGAAGALRDLAKSLDDDAKADLLATIIEESERLNRFIANLLDMTKLESGAVAPNAALHDVGEIVGSALERASKILAQAPRGSRDRARPADGDGGCRAVRAGAVQSARQRRQVCAGPQTTMRIQSWRDAGQRCGCRCWTRARAFRRTTWSASSTSSTGCRRAIRCAPARGSASPSRAASWRPCGGTIVAANRTDRKGAAFTISLPVPKSAERGKGAAMSAAPAKILVIDDEPPIRKLLRMGLASQGYEVLEAPNGKTALELLAKKPDARDPRSRAARHRRPGAAAAASGSAQEDVPIVVLSSRGDEAGKVAALDLGADDYVTKPFGMEELLARMRAALRHQLQVHGERPVFQVGELERRPGAPHRQEGRRRR